jgi:hypothetical protein
MNCARARAILWPSDRPQLAGDDVVEARRHVEGCPSCERALTYDTGLLAAFARLRGETLPVAVRERVYDAVARARAHRSGAVTERSREHRRRRYQLLGAGFAAAVVVAVAAAAALRDAHTPVGVGVKGADVREADAFIDDYVRRAVREEHITTADVSLVARFLARELGMFVELVDMDGFEIEGAEVCLLDGHRGALVVYKRDAQILSYYVLPRRGGNPMAPVVRTASSPAGEAGATVVTWATAQAEYALVGPLSARELLDAARGAVSARRDPARAARTEW